MIPNPSQQPEPLQPQVTQPQANPPVLTSAGPGSEALPADAPARRRLWPILFFSLLLLLLFAIVVLLLVPPWRARYVTPAFDSLSSRLPGGDQPQISAQPGQALIGGQTPTPAPTPVPTFTATATPHPALALNFAIAQQPDQLRWRIAYPGPARQPGGGCASLSFWLTGPDAEQFALLDELSAQLLIYDGPFVFERYGPLPLPALRGLADRRFYELPPGEPDCRNHRLAKPAQYDGMDFRLELLAGEQSVRSYRGIFRGPARRFATPTPTPTDAPPTATPFPQVQIRQQMNVRTGPGLAYPILGAARPGEVYAVQAANPQFNWWQIDYTGRPGWVFADLVTAQAVDGIAVAGFIAPPPPPPPTATPVPPTATPSPVPTPYYPFLLSSSGSCQPNPAITYFQGSVITRAGEPMNGACIHVAYEGPRNTKCSGCDGATAGSWGFAPFGNLPGKPGTTVRIYIVPCPDSPVPIGGQNPDTGFGPLAPVSPVWTRTIGESVQCTGITFQDNRFFDESGQQIPPPGNASGIAYSGTGNQTVGSFALKAGSATFNASHSGSATFAVWLIDEASRSQIAVVASGSGPVESTQTVAIPYDGQFYLNITADGAWTVSATQ